MSKPYKEIAMVRGGANFLNGNQMTDFEGYNMFDDLKREDENQDMPDIPPLDFMAIHSDDFPSP